MKRLRKKVTPFEHAKRQRQSAKDKAKHADAMAARVREAAMPILLENHSRFVEGREFVTPEEVAVAYPDLPDKVRAAYAKGIDPSLYGKVTVSNASPAPDAKPAEEQPTGTKHCARPGNTRRSVRAMLPMLAVAMLGMSMGIPHDDTRPR